MNKKESPRCIVCGSSEIEKYIPMKDYSLLRCKKCTIVWDQNSSRNLLKQYSKTYFMNENPKGGYANYFEGMRINRKTFTERLQKAEKVLGKKGKLLDVGCALGDCLLEAKKLGWKDSEGIEVSDYAFNFAKERGLKVKKGILKKDSYPEKLFDIVTYQDVIEHISGPVSELKKAKKFIKPGGYIFLVTPDIGGWWHTLLGSAWYHYKPGEHVVYFSQGSLRKALEKAGFVSIKTKKTYHVLSVEYVFNRLKYYWPALFEGLLKLVQKSSLKNVSFRAYTGEIEAWGQKPN